MKTISQFKYKEREFDFLIDKGFIGYSFKDGDKCYGHKLPLTSKKAVDIMNVTALLVINAIETAEAL